MKFWKMNGAGNAFVIELVAKVQGDCYAGGMWIK